MNEDLYALLGVDKDASGDEIKKAYRELARKYHPDANPDDDEAEKKFKEIAMAYEVLSDESRRRQYDQFGLTNGRGNAGFPGNGGVQDIFEAFFGSGSPFGGSNFTSGVSNAGADIEVAIEISLEEVVLGGESTFSIRIPLACGICEGTGSESGDSEACQTCEGQGQVQRVRQSVLGQIMSTAVCPTCKGHRTMIVDPCSVCDGNGVTESEEKFTIEIVKGVDTGVTQRLSGLGPAGTRGGARGDIHARYVVQDHERFQRSGENLLEQLWIPVTQAALGAAIEYETIDTTETLTIPAGTKTGDRFRFRGLGVPKLQRRGRGDLIVEVVVDTPTDLSKLSAELLEQLAIDRDETTLISTKRKRKRRI
ncbi:MAG: molecular chaperone DnaJ [Acidimicrobiales bacterium]|nr:molecular chaperone DnaJ [Acidimicrobiales bacterium]MDP6298695.1 molecular chaperone DnaJ [Acidimicrobiales bacterium]HJM27832.1 molecular chaperone DnaJ [Acidimicrobiales bacterium]HJM96701.1 molecular chaperone DnaJ [Acidimicrobiales bacterium]